MLPNKSQENTTREHECRSSAPRQSLLLPVFNQSSTVNFYSVHKKRKCLSILGNPGKDDLRVLAGRSGKAPRITKAGVWLYWKSRLEWCSRQRRHAKETQKTEAR